MSEILVETVKTSVPIMIAAFGGLFGELAGVLNIALEGQILISALFSAYITDVTQSLILGLFGGIISSFLLSLVFVFFSFTLRANIFLVGLGINLLSLSFSRLFGVLISGKKGAILFHHIPEFSDTWFYYALVLFPIMYIIVYYTRFGFHLRAVGENQKVAMFSGIYPGLYKIWGIMLSGVFCGISGFFLSVPLSVFIQNMSGGRGWLAIVAIFLGGRNVGGVFIASLFIGLAFVVSHFVQITSGVDPELSMAFPYIASLLFLILYKRR